MNPGIEYTAEIPAGDDFVRLFRASGWTEASEVAEDRLVASLASAWYGICARQDGRVIGTGLVLSDGVLHALIVDVIVMPELRGRGIGTEIMRRLIAHCRAEDVLQIQLFSALGKRGFYEGLGFVARPDDGPGMEFGGPG
jgi:GNAT superfamily N-acetyltransferase